MRIYKIGNSKTFSASRLSKDGKRIKWTTELEKKHYKLLIFLSYQYQESAAKIIRTLLNKAFKKELAALSKLEFKLKGEGLTEDEIIQRLRTGGEMPPAPPVK